MKVELINQLKEYTTSKEILLLVLNLEDGAKEVLDLYKELKEYYPYDKGDKTTDKIVKIYIEEVLNNDNKVLKALFRSEETILKKLMEIKDDVDPSEILNSYIAISKAIDSSKDDEENCQSFAMSVLLNEEYPKYFGLLDHINLLNLVIMHSDSREVTALLKLLIEWSYEFDIISKYVGAYKTCKILEQKYLMKKAVNRERGIKLSKESLVEAARIIPTLDNPEEINLVQDALNEPEWQADINFKTIYELIRIIVKNKYKRSKRYFKTFLLRERNIQEISEMMELSYVSPELEDLIFDPNVIRHLTWENQKNLIHIFNLKDDSNRANFYQIYRKFAYQVERQALDRSDLYLTVLNELNKEEYFTSVEDYLKTSKTIEDFINALNENYKETDDVLPSSSLKVRKNKLPQ